jgi:glutamine amidotransferase
MVAIIDYGMGNIASVQKALNYLSIPSILTSSEVEIKSASSIILPGVGSFMQGMENLKSKELDHILTEEVMGKGKIFLGICLGMQLIAETGDEPILNKGLGWIPGHVKKLSTPGLNIPHMGWNDITSTDGSFLERSSHSSYS